jgi:hypothetical protein
MRDGSACPDFAHSCDKKEKVMSILPLIRAAAGALAAGIRSTLGLLASLPRRNLDRVWYWLSPTPGYVPFVVLRKTPSKDDS